MCERGVLGRNRWSAVHVPPAGDAVVERFGPYELHTLIGRGGMGEVYRAVDTRKQRGIVAVKRLPVGLADDEDFHRRFLREAELAARLRDPHVIPIHDYGEIDGQPFLDMRLVDGIDLATHLQGHGPLAPPRAIALVSQIADALDAAHREGLVHRDVKPANILLHRHQDPDRNDTDFVYLIDFGIAANLLSSRRSSSIVAGTAAYMAPERFTAGGDHRVDVYALGCLLYELLTGRTPFDGDLMQLLNAHAHADPPVPSASIPSLPRALDTVVATAMAKDPERRQSTAGSLAAGARRALITAAPRSPGTTPGTPVAPERGQAPAPPDVPPAHPRSTATRVVPSPPPRRWSATARRRVAVSVGVVVPLVVACVAVLVVVTMRPPGFPVIATVAVGGGPRSVAISPDGRRAYVANQEPATVSVIDTRSNTVTATVPVPAATSLALAPDGRRAYVGAVSDSAIRVIDTSSNTVTATVPLPLPGNGLDVTPDGQHVYISVYGAVLVLDTTTTAVIARIPLPGVEGGVAVTPDGRRAYVAPQFGAAVADGNRVHVIDTATNAVIGTVAVPGPSGGVAVGLDGRRAYVTTDAAGLSVIDTATGTGSGRVDVGNGPLGLAAAADGRRVYVTNSRDDSMSVVDSGTDTVVDTIAVGDFPTEVALTPDGRRAYVADTRDNAVSVVQVG